MSSLSEELLLHITVLQEPRSLVSAREEATRWLEAFKRRDDCHQHLFPLLSRPLPSLNPSSTGEGTFAVEVRFVCLKLLEDWAFLRWNQATADEKLFIRNGIMELLDNEELYQSARPIKIRLAKLVVEVAKRQYPQEWPQLFAELRHRWCLPDVTAAPKTTVCLLILTFLFEDIADTDFHATILSSRRDEIISALQNEYESFLIFFYEWTGAVFQRYSSLIQTGQDRNQSDEVALLHEWLLQAFQVLTPTASLTKAQSLCSLSGNLDGGVSVDFSLLSLQILELSTASMTANCPTPLDLPLSAASLLRSLCSSKLSADVFWSFIERLPGAFSQFLAALDSSGSDVAETLSFYNTLGETLGLLLSSHPEHLHEICELIGQTSEAVTNAQRTRLECFQLRASLLEAFVQMLSTLSQYPSRRLQMVLLKDWIKFERTEGVHRLGWLPALLSHLVSVFAPQAVKLLWHKSDLVEGQCSELEREMVCEEFEDAEDYMDHFGQFRNSFCVLLSDFGALDATAAAEHLQAVVQSALGGSYEAARSRISGGSLTTGDCYEFSQVFVLQLEALVAFTDTLLKAFRSLEGPSRQLGAQAFPILSSAAWTILRWVPEEDGAFMLNSARLIQSLHPLYNVDLNLLETAFTRLFDMMLYSGRSFVDEHSGRLSGRDKGLCMVEQVRRRASSAIAVLAKECSEKLIAGNLLNTLFTTAQERMNSGELSSFQMTSMLEALTALCETVSDVALRKQYLEDVLSGTVSRFNEAQSFMLSCQSLLEQLFKEVRGECQDNKLQSLKDNLTALLGVSRCVQVPQFPPIIFENAQSFQYSDLSALFPFVTAWEAVLNNVFQYASSLHKIWHGKYRMEACRKGEESSRVFVEHGGELRTLLGQNSSYELMEAPLSGSKSSSSPRNLLNHFRHQLYMLLGQACIHMAMFVTEKDEKQSMAQFLSDLGADIPFMENRHLMSLLKYFIEPLVLNCPRGSIHVVAPFMHQLLQHLSLRLQVMWSPLNVLEDPLGWTLNAEAFHHFLYRQCSLSACDYSCSREGDNSSGEHSSAVSSTESETVLEIVREKIIFDLTKATVNLLSASCCCRGNLALQKTPKDKSSDGAYNSCRRDCLLALVFGSTATATTGNGAYLPTEMTESYLSLLHQLLSIQNAFICKQSIEVCHTVLAFVQSKSLAAVAELIGSQMFSCLLRNLIDGNESLSSSELQWAMLSLVEECYTALVLGIRPASKTTGDSRAEALSCQPREVLVSATSREAVQSLEGQLLDVQVKKKRRDLFKDFVTELKAQLGKAECKSSSVKAILDIPQSHHQKSQKLGKFRRMHDDDTDSLFSGLFDH